MCVNVYNIRKLATIASLYSGLRTLAPTLSNKGLLTLRIIDCLSGALFISTLLELPIHTFLPTKATISLSPANLLANLIKSFAPTSFFLFIITKWPEDKRAWAIELLIKEFLPDWYYFSLTTKYKVVLLLDVYLHEPQTGLENLSGNQKPCQVSNKLNHRPANLSVTGKSIIVGILSTCFGSSSNQIVKMWLHRRFFPWNHDDSTTWLSSIGEGHLPSQSLKSQQLAVP